MECSYFAEGKIEQELNVPDQDDKLTLLQLEHKKPEEPQVNQDSDNQSLENLEGKIVFRYD